MELNLRCFGFLNCAIIFLLLWLKLCRAVRMVAGSCCICKSYPGQQEDVTFHRIPRNENRANQWTNIINEIGKNVSKTATVCSKHFHQREFQYKIVGGTIRRFLTSDAVPKIHVIDPTSPSQSPRNDHQETAGEKKDDTEDVIIQESILPEQENDQLEGESSTLLESEQADDQSEDESSILLERQDDSADRTTEKRARVRTIRYIGDVRCEDFISDEAYHIVNSYMRYSKQEIKLLKQKVHRMGKKIKAMQDLTKNLKKQS